MPCNSRQQQPQQQQKPTHARVLKSVQACHLALGGGDIAIVTVVASLRLPTAAADYCRSSCAFAAFFVSAAVVVAAFTLFSSFRRQRLHYCLLLLLLLRRLRSSSPPSSVPPFRHRARVTATGDDAGAARRHPTTPHRAELADVVHPAVLAYSSAHARCDTRWRPAAATAARCRSAAAFGECRASPPPPPQPPRQTSCWSRSKSPQSGWLPGIAKKQPMRRSPPPDAGE